jgi:putative ABC transport system ATP-binding protein
MTSKQLATSFESQLPSSPLAIVCTAVKKEFGEGQARVQVLRGVDLEIPRGKTTFLVGPSGCGKTTLISIIAGLLTTSSGAIDVLGQPVTTLRGAKLVSFRAQHMGFIFQQFNLLPSLTAAENAAVTLVVQGQSLASAKRQSIQLLDRLGMGQHLNKYPNQLSGGQQQRIAIARALVHNPRIVICDEPTASLDAETGQAVMELLRQVSSRQDRAVIVVTHDSRIFSFADRIASMSDGIIVKVEDNASTTPTNSTQMQARG